jgi:Cu+-exporting ATPase
LKRANNVTTEFEIDGMTCGNCARHVTEAIQSVPDVRSAAVSLENKNAVVRWNASKNVPAVLLAVKNAGYGAKEAIASDHAHAHKDWQLGLWLGIAVTAFLMAGEWIFQFGSTPWFIWTSFALAGVVQIYAGAPFYRGAWRQLKTGSSNMDTLVALGSTTAFGYSAWALLIGATEHLYFMEAAAIITLISLGHSIEARVSERAGGALKALLHLAPQTARKTSGQEVPVSELQIDDEILLRPGDRVPVDGVVREGESAVDESTLTGESAPVEKNVGGELFTGTTNLNGRLVMRVTATGEETALAHVIAAVQRAQTSRANIQRLGDRVSGVFVPVVIVIAIAAGLWWGLAPDSANRVHESLARFLWHGHVPAGAAAGFIIAAAVLIIACPCAMGLATPVAIMAGANAAARRGILIRDGVALEKAGKISAIVFDKTGTLTMGKPKVAAVCEIQRSRNTCQSLAAALARDSSHPISQAIARISAEKIPIESWREIRGAGIEATIQNSVGKLRLGSLPWLQENGIDSSQGEHFTVEWSAHGATIVGLAVEKNLLALLAVLDSLKPNADSVIKQLQHQGLKIFLVTGDNSRTAAGVASLVGIAQQNVLAEVRPERKADFVKKLQAAGERVAFVGDGINDAPALTQADLGIAVSRASDIAREAADIILLRSEISGVPEALGLAQATLKTIKQNLFWAFFYNSLGVPLASLGFISPILCAAAMGASDLIVIGNALRLLQKRKPLA